MKHFLVAIVSMLAAVGFGDVVKDIAYDASLGAKGIGDLYRPDGWTAETPVVLQIHGGGWTALDRASWAGVAQYFTEKLGYASFNIEYRLAPEHPWPACAKDCLKAANYLLSPDFATTYGLQPKRIWICGGSAGGHLALWTGLSLPADKVAGIISISGIGNPHPDAAAHPDRYKAVFGNRTPTEADFAAIDPRNLLKTGVIPKILQTHVDHDTAVPIESARDFAARVKELGGASTFIEYKKADVTTTGGHCIWVPGSNPHELIPTVKQAIESFVSQRGVIALTNRFGSARIETLGARVTSYVPAGGAETLALLASGTGGIPLLMDTGNGRYRTWEPDRTSHTEPPKGPVPERAGAYPEADMLGVIPARGLYIRKVDNLTLKNVTFETTGTAKRETLVQE